MVGIVPKSRSGGETGHKDGTSAGSFKWGKIFTADYYGRLFGQLPNIKKNIAKRQPLGLKLKLFPKMWDMLL